jgi:hypothetical protein
MWLTRRQKDGYRKGKGKSPEHRSPCPFPGLPPNGAGNRVLLKFTKSMMSLKVIKSRDLPFFFLNSDLFHLEFSCRRGLVVKPAILATREGNDPETPVWRPVRTNKFRRVHLNQ